MRIIDKAVIAKSPKTKSEGAVVVTDQAICVIA
jgi:hypothetical protein